MKLKIKDKSVVEYQIMTNEKMYGIWIAMTERKCHPQIVCRDRSIGLRMSLTCYKLDVWHLGLHVRYPRSEPLDIGQFN